MKHHYKPLLIASYVIATYIIVVSLTNRVAFYLTWSIGKDIHMLSSAAVLLFLHYYLMWKTCRENLISDKMVTVFRIVDYWLYGIYLTFLVSYSVYALLPFGPQISVGFIIPNAFLSIAILGMRKYTSEKWVD